MRLICGNISKRCRTFQWIDIFIEAFVSRSFKWFMAAFLEQENVTQHKISIPLQSYLQCRRRPVINFNSNRLARPPRARKLHVTLEYLCGRTLPFSTSMTNWLQNPLCATSLSPTVGSQIFLFVGHDSHEQQNLPPSWNLSKQTSFSAWSQRVRSNAWLLSYERSTNENTRSCSQKSVEKRSIICQS